MFRGMKTLATLIGQRGQVSIPAEVREQLNLTPGMRVVWTVDDAQTCTVTVAPVRKPCGARAMLGFASTFGNNAKTTDEWLTELRAGEEP